MPVYEYRCNTCNHQFEMRQKFSDPPAKECPVCGKEVHKMISRTAFSLKGDGWFDSGYCAKNDAPKPSCCQAGGCCPAANTA
ncbi:MAG: zinc ribbon domain-containing protein [Trichlorobacter sp.]|jgi:putative FmdB family regulatory protein|nr:zinc ribbon domain-containing protein [Trichlorobacter sp.]